MYPLPAAAPDELDVDVLADVLNLIGIRDEMPHNAPGPVDVPPAQRVERQVRGPTGARIAAVVAVGGYHELQDLVGRGSTDRDVLAVQFDDETRDTAVHQRSPRSWTAPAT